ncbi:pimeloyl-ACP methyl ester carboxylesterase [Chitinophaga polysaccharea]|uniref:Pimeloyl-ACP methyl ester carboxylesterase n=1 Tax=Chitinophaga polysaccharea TaxID=1293035 RepID=A0A561Q226_9BACT|nr:alpha/beta hydrolase [Chitinophaga polysaccharea]TWF44415.1 pimeloyl-ACP methyl ester carboxylesterase [Chitinophaga polysaccharea]
MQTNKLPILFLHGALGATSQFQPLAAGLSEHYEVHQLNFSGHGDVPFSEQGFSIQVFAAEVLSYLENKDLDFVHVFGYSMGGYVAMYLARHYPEKIGRVITLATKYNWNEATAGKEVKQLDPAVIEEKVPAFAKLLAERHTAGNWKTVVSRTAQLIEELGHQALLKPHDYAQIVTPCMLMMGDRDNMVSFQETIEVYKALPLAQFTVLPDTAHPLEKADVPLLAYYIRRFTTQNI